MLSYNGILMSSSCFVIWQVCNAQANGTGDLWGHSDCAQAPVFTAPFTGMDFHSVWQAVGSVCFSKLHCITRERHRMWSWMKGNHRFIGQLFFLCCDSICCQGVYTLSICFIVMADVFIPLDAEAVPRTDGYKNVSQGNISEELLVHCQEILDKLAYVLLSLYRKKF